MARPLRTVPGELPVFTRYYDLFTWSFQRAEAFPKVLRPTLTPRFLELLLGALEALLELRYTRERAARFAGLNLTLEKLRVLWRALKDRRALSLTQYEFFNRELNEGGRMVGGWMKANARKASAPAAAAGVSQVAGSEARA